MSDAPSNRVAYKFCAGVLKTVGTVDLRGRSEWVAGVGSQETRVTRPHDRFLVYNYIMCMFVQCKYNVERSVRCWTAWLLFVVHVLLLLTLCGLQKSHEKDRSLVRNRTVTFARQTSHTYVDLVPERVKTHHVNAEENE